MVPKVGNAAATINCCLVQRVSQRSVSSFTLNRWPLGRMLLFILLGCILDVRGTGVATSHQSVVSGEGWRYGYEIAHGPPGIGHAVGESFPHGYGGFGTYAPSFGYETKPIIIPIPPPEPIIINVPQYVVPYHYNYLPYGHVYPYGYEHANGLDYYGYGHLGHAAYYNGFNSGYH